MTFEELELLRKPFRIPKNVVLEVPPSTEGEVDLDGLASKVAVFPTMFFNGLRVPFYHPVPEVLDFLQLVLAQLIPKA